MKVQAHSFFRTTTGIQSGPEAFDESSFVMTFLTIFGIMEICNFRLVLERKTGKEIPESLRLEFLEKFLAKNFVLFVLHGNCLNSIYWKFLFQRFIPADLKTIKQALGSEKTFLNRWYFHESILYW